MKFLSTLAVSALLAMGMASGASAGEGSKYLKAGTLTCFADKNIGLLVGSHRNVDCAYRGLDGAEDLYTGEINRLGLDLGITGAQTIVWVVFAAGEDAGNLSGTYVGGSAEASFLLGANVNALFGGFRDSYALQPISAGGQAGLNVALGLASMTLEPVNE